MSNTGETATSGGKINYSAIIEKHSWVTTKNRPCVISADSDGFLCGLLMSHVLSWEIAGFYDAKVLLLKKGLEVADCVFLDIEINKSGVGSIGNHMVEYNRSLPLKNNTFDECIQPNMLRGFDGKNDFQRKYPFATIHLLISIIQNAGLINKLPESAISPLLFVDGVGNNLFGYPENCLDWIQYLKIDNKEHILHGFLCENEVNFYKVMRFLKLFFAMRDRHNAKGYFNGTDFVSGGRNMRTGHQIKISNGTGTPINLTKNKDGTYCIHAAEATRVEGFIDEVGKMVGWEYAKDNWNWNGFQLITLQKGMLSSEVNSWPNLNNKTYTDLFTKNPISLAMTASNRIEYSLLP